MKTMLAISLATVIVFLILSGSPETTYKTNQRSVRSTMTLEFHWMPEPEVMKFCRFIGADSNQITINSCFRISATNPSVCEIYAGEPMSFNDKTRLAVVGHNVWHCLGANHE
jgi:hypothetical protein